MLNQQNAHMSFPSIACGALPAAVSISHFAGQSGVDEYHLMVRPTAYADIATQLTWVDNAYREACTSLGLHAATQVLKRFFCSDLPNQAAALAAHPAANPGEGVASCALSWVCQPPMPPAKIALWAYHISPPDGELDKRREGATLSLRRGELTHRWTTGLTSPERRNLVAADAKLSSCNTKRACARRGCSWRIMCCARGSSCRMWMPTTRGWWRRAKPFSPRAD